MCLKAVRSILGEFHKDHKLARSDAKAIEAARCPFSFAIAEEMPGDDKKCKRELPCENCIPFADEISLP
ncbi:hypothetical protein DXT91_10015 [Agrobacterium tumefaciens]|nr:hypothetical protein [Agrobacterium tumefaciens]